MKVIDKPITPPTNYKIAKVYFNRDKCIVIASLIAIMAIAMFMILGTQLIAVIANLTGLAYTTTLCILLGINILSPILLTLFHLYRFCVIVEYMNILSESEGYVLECEAFQNALEKFTTLNKYRHLLPGLPITIDFTNIKSKKYANLIKIKELTIIGIRQYIAQLVGKIDITKIGRTQGLDLNLPPQESELIELIKKNLHKILTKNHEEITSITVDMGSNVGNYLSNAGKVWTAEVDLLNDICSKIITDVLLEKTLHQLTKLKHLKLDLSNE
jgi:hypothetical protein